MEEKFIIQFVGIDRILRDKLGFLPVQGNVSRQIRPRVKKALYQELAAEISRRFRLNGFLEAATEVAENPVFNIKGKIVKLITTSRYRPQDMERDIVENGINRFFFLITPFHRTQFLNIAKENGFACYRQSLPVMECGPADTAEAGHDVHIADMYPDSHFISMILNDNAGDTHNHGKGSISSPDGNNIGNGNSNNNQNDRQKKSIGDTVKSIGKWVGRQIICVVTEHVITSIFRQIYWP